MTPPLRLVLLGPLLAACAAPNTPSAGTPTSDATPTADASAADAPAGACAVFPLPDEPVFEDTAVDITAVTWPPACAVESDEDGDGIPDARTSWDVSGATVTEARDDGLDGTVDGLLTVTRRPDGQLLTEADDEDADGQVDLLRVYDYGPGDRLRTIEAFGPGGRAPPDRALRRPGERSPRRSHRSHHHLRVRPGPPCRHPARRRR